ncbi:MAG: hypothetical protein M3Q07_24845, partial [Pseudobdellovibrionaceae bacterium]|nr:hypothetical protein [Pseudobdellovibrionaceae bacterium]
CWGGNGYGQLGDGTIISKASPLLKPIDFGPGVKARQIYAGSSHTCALLDNNGVKCWGAGYAGQLGLKDFSGMAPGELSVGYESPVY